MNLKTKPNMDMPVNKQQKQFIYKSIGYNKADMRKNLPLLPEQLNSYLDLLNKLFKYHYDVLGNDPRFSHGYIKENIHNSAIGAAITEKQLEQISLQIPNLNTSTDMQDEEKRKDVLNYLTFDVHDQNKMAGINKNFIVAMATSAKGKKKKAKKKKKKKRGEDDDDDDTDDEDKPKTKKGKKKLKAGTKKTRKGKKKEDEVEDDAPKNKTEQIVKTYNLSDLSNFKNGITEIPAENYSSKIISFRAEPAKPYISCFREREVDEIYYYTPDLIAGVMSTEGTGYIMYPNRETAIEIRRGRIGKKMIIYTESGKDEQGIFRDSVPVAIFDESGNGVVFDIFGNIRLNYDQGEGIYYDTPSKIPFFWKWNKSQFLIQRRKELRYVDENDPDDEVEISEIQVEEVVQDEEEDKVLKKKGKSKKRRKSRKSLASARSVVSRKSDTKRKKIKSQKTGTRKKKPTRKMKKQKSENDNADDDDNNEDKLKKKRKKKKGKTQKTTRTAKKDKKTSKKSVTKEGDLRIYSTKKPVEEDRKSLEENKWGKLKTVFELTAKLPDQTKRALSTVHKPTKHTIPIPEIKPLVLRINNHISLRIIHQEHIHIDFAYYPVHLSYSVTISNKYYIKHSQTSLNQPF